LQLTSANNVLIDYEVWGKGPPVLLIHGFASNARVNWIDTGWVKTLNQAGYQAITFDNRGHGRSSKPHEPQLYTAELMAEDAKRLIQHLGRAAAFVIGYSMGARIAAVLMLRHPTFVTAAVLGGLAANLIHGLGHTEEIARILEADQPDPRAGKQVLDYRKFAQQTGSDRKALAACMRASRQEILERDLLRINVPVLVVAGSEDATAGPVQPLVKALAKGEGLVLPGRDHMKAVGDRTFKEETIKFFDRVRASEGPH
jgi:pimeloyl-ACP methyl ester carboxylesterase